MKPSEPWQARKKEFGLAARVRPSRAAWSSYLKTIFAAALIILLAIYFLFHKLIEDKFFDHYSYIGVILFIVFVIWLAFHEMGASARNSKKNKKRSSPDHDLLEYRVAERTNEFIRFEKKTVEQADEMIQFGKISQGLIHDLMSPLTSIALYVNQIDSGIVNVSEAKELVNRAISVSSQMKSFIDSVRQRFPNNHSLIPSTTNVVDEIYLIRDLLAYKAKIENVTITIEKSEPIFVKIPPTRVRQVISNLITNSIDAFETIPVKFALNRNLNQRQISILISHHEKTASIVVKDNASGISATHMELLFKQGFTTKTKGSGLGLMTVKSIIEDELHGTIEVRSQKGLGTEFEISFPII